MARGQRFGSRQISPEVFRVTPVRSLENFPEAAMFKMASARPTYLDSAYEKFAAESTSLKICLMVGQVQEHKGGDARQKSR